MCDGGLIVVCKYLVVVSPEAENFRIPDPAEVVVVPLTSCRGAAGTAATGGCPPTPNPPELLELTVDDPEP